MVPANTPNSGGSGGREWDPNVPWRDWEVPSGSGPFREPWWGGQESRPQLLTLRDKGGEPDPVGA